MAENLDVIREDTDTIVNNAIEKIREIAKNF